MDSLYSGLLSWLWMFSCSSLVCGSASQEWLQQRLISWCATTRWRQHDRLRKYQLHYQLHHLSLLCLFGIRTDLLLSFFSAGSLFLYEHYGVSFIQKLTKAIVSADVQLSDADSDNCGRMFYRRSCPPPCLWLFSCASLWWTDDLSPNGWRRLVQIWPRRIQSVESS